MAPRITRVLCVAEKPSVSKAVSRMLSNDSYTATNTKNKYIKNYAFTSKWHNQAQDVSVVMTAVSGHLMDQDFDPAFKKWTGCDPEDLYTGMLSFIISQQEL
jgi:DNA topoisomerase-3